MWRCAPNACIAVAPKRPNSCSNSRLSWPSTSDTASRRSSVRCVRDQLSRPYPQSATSQSPASIARIARTMERIWLAADRERRLLQGDARRDEVDVAALGVRDPRAHPELAHLRVGEGLCERIERRARDVVPLEAREPLGARGRDERVRQDRAQLPVVRDAIRSATEPLVLRELGPADRPSEAREELLWRREVDDEREAVARAERVHLRDARPRLACRHVAGREIARRVLAEERGAGLEERGLDALP